MKTVFFASGSGSNFLNLIDHYKNQTLDISEPHLITDRENCGAFKHALREGISCEAIVPKDYETFEHWDQAVEARLRQIDPQLIVLVGFLRRIGSQVLHSFSGRIINTHPSLLPKYGGKGMYGLKVHERVIASGDSETGITVHLVNEDYDKGLIIEQKKLKVNKGETALSLQDRLKSIEHQFLYETLRNYINENK